MPLYSCAVVGTGTDADPFRAPFDGDAGIGWIKLASRGLLYLPDAVIDPRVRLIADSPTERPSLGIRTVWQNELGITLATPSTGSFAELVAEILREHGRTDGTRWGFLQPSKARQRFEIFLGALGAIWSTPAAVGPSTQSFSETWPTNGTTISSGQNQVWSEELGDAEVAAGVIRSVNQTAISCRCESVLDTSNQYHQADFTIDEGGANGNNFALRVRHLDTNNHYRVNVRRSSGQGYSRLGEKRVASVNTNIVPNSAVDPGGSGLARVTIDGSTMSIKVGAYEASGTDSTPELLTQFKGGFSIFPPSNTGSVTLDNHLIADVVAGAAGTPFIATIGARLI